jgi:hypothetical protein
MPYRHQIARSDEQVGFAKIHLTFLHLNGPQHHEQAIAIQFHLRTLMGVVRVLGGQFVQAEQILNLRHQFFGRLAQPQPNEGVWPIPQCWNVLQQGVGQLTTVGIGGAIDDHVSIFLLLPLQ